MAVDFFAEANDFPGWTDKKSYQVSDKIISGRNVRLIKPQTFMNLSGKAVRESLKKYGCFEMPESADASNIIVIHDDLDLDFGNYKIKPGGSGGSHNGVNSVINSLQSKNFIRLKLGINSPGRREFQAGADYVLSNFSKEEIKKIPDILKTSGEILSVFISGGIARAMNDYNNRKQG